MFRSAAAAAVIGFTGLSLAAPYSNSTPTSSSCTPQGQVPFKFPLSNGFPNITIPSDALNAIQKQAHGTLPNGGLPNNVSPSSLTSFALIAYNEIFEVAYFTSLISNITSNVPGYQIADSEQRETILDALIAIQGQEQLHALGVNAILATNGAAPIQPCEYIFPVSTWQDAIALASVFTDVVLGTLQAVELGLGTNNDDELLPLLGSVIGQEGEQDGWFRSLGGKIPSALPFLTGGAGPFAYSVLNQLFIVPNSCPTSVLSALGVFGPLTITTPNIALADQTLSFSITTNASTDGLSVVYINQQNSPVVSSITNVQKNGNAVTFQAPFPGETNLMNGLTIAAVVNGAGPFASPADVAAKTVFGPGIIEIN